MCPSCKHENRAGRTFCVQCGGALPLACRSCGATIEPRERFCGECGEPLAEAVHELGEAEPLRRRVEVSRSRGLRKGL